MIDKLVRQSDFRHIPAEGCLLFCLLAGPQKFFGTAIEFHKIAYAYKHLLDQGYIREDCYVLEHPPVGSLACSLVIRPEYEVIYQGKKDYVKPQTDTWGSFYNPTFTILHGVMRGGTHHFRLGDALGFQVWDPASPPPEIIAEASIRFYKIQLRPQSVITAKNDGWRDAGAVDGK